MLTKNSTKKSISRKKTIKKITTKKKTIKKSDPYIRAKKALSRLRSRN